MILSKFLRENIFFLLTWGLVSVLGLILGISARVVEGEIKLSAAVESKEDRGRAFEAVRTVLQSPRCQNCHIPGDEPLSGDKGDLHGMNVKRGEDGRGTPALPCTNCHQTTNGSFPHSPPGAVNWHLPPPSTPMVFINLPAGELCQDLKNPLKNGGKTAEELVKHVSSDNLVLWGWNPGPGRTKPPITHAEFVTHFTTWVSAGLPCP